jgi:hypothetical protein
MTRSLLLTVAVGAVALVPPGCSKKNPSSPGGAAGTPVYLQTTDGTPTVTISRHVQIKGRVINQSGLTIYDVRIEMTVYRDDPIFARVTDTSEVKIAMLENGKTADFSTFDMPGDQFINAAPVWSYLPPE